MSVIIASAECADNRNFIQCAYCGEGKKTVQMWAIMGTVVPLHFDCESDYCRTCNDDGTLPGCAA
jgi:hypothetical protein